MRNAKHGGGQGLYSYPAIQTQWCSWLRHCTTHQKVVGSIPDGVIGIFH